MNNKFSKDNIYKEGTFITAKSAPDQKLLIREYRHRTYYCEVVGDSSQGLRPYFEKELIPPSAAKAEQEIHSSNAPSN